MYFGKNEVTMKETTYDDVLKGFFGILGDLMEKMEGGAWRFWWRAIGKFLEMKDPFRFEEIDVALTIEIGDATSERWLARCQRMNDGSGESVVTKGALALFLQYTTRPQGKKIAKYVIGTSADLFGITGMSHNSVFYDPAFLDRFGLEFCEPVDAFAIRAALPTQEYGAGLYIMTEPLADGTSGKKFYFKVLRYVECHDKSGALRLNITETEPQYSAIGQVLVFRLREG